VRQPSLRRTGGMVRGVRRRALRRAAPGPRRTSARPASTNCRWSPSSSPPAVAHAAGPPAPPGASRSSLNLWNGGCPGSAGASQAHATAAHVSGRQRRRRGGPGAAPRPRITRLIARTSCCRCRLLVTCARRAAARPSAGCRSRAALLCAQRRIATCAHAASTHGGRPGPHRACTTSACQAGQHARR